MNRSFVVVNSNQRQRLRHQSSHMSPQQLSSSQNNAAPAWWCNNWQRYQHSPGYFWKSNSFSWKRCWLL